MAYKGKYTAKNPKKYRGNVTNIIYRSLWERQVMKYLDLNSSILEWSSEEVIIPYNDPQTGRTRRYYPDFWLKKKSKDGTIETIIMEVKPARQTKPPVKKGNRVNKRFIHESITYATNLNKWKAAEAFCEALGWKFKIITEHNLQRNK